MMRPRHGESAIAWVSVKDYANERSFKAALLLVFIAGFLSSASRAQYGGGTGEPNDPYLIYTAEQMNAIGADPDDWDRHFKLMADIDLSGLAGEQFNIIGNGPTPFGGSFDGNGHAVLNFTYKSAGKRCIGLFGAVAIRSYTVPIAVQNVELIDPNVDGAEAGYVGSLVGFVGHGTIVNCHVAGGRVSGGYGVGGLIGGTIDTRPLSAHAGVQIEVRHCHAATHVTGTHDVGGLVGFFQGPAYPTFRPVEEYCRISDCYSTGDVRGQRNVGGLAGYASYVDLVSGSYSYASVSGDSCVGGLIGCAGLAAVERCYGSGQVAGIDEVGGLVGNNDPGGTIVNCYSVARVSGTSLTGGLAGRNFGTVRTCYAAGPVKGESLVGGLIGSSDGDAPLLASGSVSDSFWDADMSGQATSAGGVGKPTWQMRQRSTFADWDFTDVWDIAENQTYPFLRGFVDNSETEYQF